MLYEVILRNTFYARARVTLRKYLPIARHIVSRGAQHAHQVMRLFCDAFTV